jgi:guanylate kinase
VSRSKTSHEPLIVVLTAPSGTGKSTVAASVFAAEPGLAFSVSHTTRPQREGEVDGEDYHFVSDAEFDQLVAEDAFAEWAHVHKRRYGTSKAEVARILGEGHDILLDVDAQGAHVLLAAYPEAVSIFMLPPSMAELATRLQGRSTDSADQIATRLKTARSEIRDADKFSYTVVNGEVAQATAEFLAILHAERRRFSRNKGVWMSLTEEAARLDRKDNS